GAPAHRSRDPAREIDGEEPRDEQAAEERETEPADERDDAGPELVLRPGRDERAAELLVRPEEERLRDRDIGPVLARRDEVEADRLATPEVVDGDGAPREPGESGRLLREKPERGKGRDVVQVVAGGARELIRGHRVVRMRDPVRVEVGEPRRLAIQLRPRPRERVAVEQAERERRRDEPREDDAGEEEGRKPEAQRAQHGPLLLGAVPRRRDLVADPPDGHDRRGVAELPAQLADVDVDGARVTGEGVAPHALEELVAREDEAAVVEELPEQVELLRRELDLLLPDAHLAPARVDVQVAVPDLRALARLAHRRRAA